jgi:hypothetical protein
MSTIDTKQRRRLEKRLSSIAEAILGEPSQTSRSKDSLVTARSKAASLQRGMDDAAYGVKRMYAEDRKSDAESSEEANEKAIASVANFIAGIREMPEDSETPSLDWYNAQDIDSDDPYDPDASRPNLSTSDAQKERNVSSDQNRAAGEGLPSFIMQGSAFREAISGTEADSYDSMFGNAERVDGKFLGTELTAMPMSAVFDLVELNGDFHKRNLELGHDTTAVGKYQFVGNTLRDLRDRGILEELGIGDDTIFDEETQDKIAVHLARRRVKPEYSMARAREELVNEWEGFGKLPKKALNEIINEIRGA